MIITKEDIGKTVWHRLNGREYEVINYFTSLEGKICFNLHHSIHNPRNHDNLHVYETGLRVGSSDIYPIVSWVKEEYVEPPKRMVKKTFWYTRNKNITYGTHHPAYVNNSAFFVNKNDARECKYGNFVLESIELEVEE